MKKLGHKLKALLALTIITVIACACAVKSPMPDGYNSMHDKALQESIAANQRLSSKNSSALPPAISRALMPGVNLPPSAMGHKNSNEDDNHFDIAVNNVPAKDFFMGLVKGTKYNMVVNPKVAGNISLELKNVTIPQVMDAARDTYGYEYEKTSYGYQVSPRALATRVFTVNYIDIERNGQSQTAVGSGQITNTVQNTLTTSGVSTSQTSGSMPNGIVQTSSSSKFWDLLKQNLQTIVGTEEGRSVVVNPTSGNIIIKAYPDELRAVGQYLDKIQNNIQRQVIIEAKIIEVELNAAFQAGLNWKLLGIQEGAPQGSTPSTILPDTPDFPASTAPAFALNTSYGWSFNTAIQLLNKQGTVNVLSSPRVSTINNQKAVIKVGDDHFFVTNVSSNTSSGSASPTTSQNITLTPFFSGITLDVTPQIDENGTVTLHIHPIISQVTQEMKKFEVFGSNQSLPLAASTERESDSVVRAQNGQVIVLGGLMENSSYGNNSGTPGADKLPGIGGLFKSTNKSAKKYELVILLRPIVVDSTNVWQQRLNDAATTLKSMKGDFRYDVVPVKQD